MVFLFVALLIAVPLAELYVIFQVAREIGVLETVLVLIAVSVLGGWLVRRVGMGLFARSMGQLAAGRLPTDEMISGGAVLVAGALMLTPGFLTDIVGLVLLLPPVRAGVVALVRRRFRANLARGHASAFAVRFGQVVDADGVPRRRPSRQSELD